MITNSIDDIKQSISEARWTCGASTEESVMDELVEVEASLS
jgi:hypothetical protein